MRVLVTGATGFLGFKLASRLHNLGYTVIGTGRNLEQGNRLEELGIKFLKANLEDHIDVMLAVQGVDYVFHCAALSSPWGKYEDFYASNVVATENLLNESIKEKVKRFIHVSTPSIYFEHRDSLMIKESDPLPIKSVNFYAKTKLMAEDLVDKAFQEGLEVITIRPRALFGPGDNAILPRLIYANDKIGVPIINQAQAIIDVTYVENVVDALLLCMEADTTALGKKYNITNGEPMKLHDLLDTLFKELGIEWKQRKISLPIAYSLAGISEIACRYLLLGKEPILTKYTVGVLGVSQTLDITLAKELLGYKPRYTIHEGLIEFAKWWKEESK